MTVLSKLKRKLSAIWPHLDERTRRLMAANEAISLGYGGVSLVSRACGLSRVAIHKGMREIRNGAPAPGQIRRSGAGRKPITEIDPKIVKALDEMIQGDNRGDSEPPLRWICKSTREISAALGALGHSVSHTKVGQLLHAQDYRLYGSLKTKGGAHDHSDRDEQFRHISAEVTKFLAQDFPVVWVYTKKTGSLSDYKSRGGKRATVGRVKPVRGQAVSPRQAARTYPYGIYDLGRNTGFAELRTDYDTGEFAVASIRGWWRAEGRNLYPKAERLLVTSDIGANHSYKLNLWMLEWQKVADETALDISICHFPRGTSKWNQIERRLFSFLSSSWRGELPCDFETVVSLIAINTSAKELEVSCRLDRRRYSKGRKYRGAHSKQIRVKRNTYHGNWNYVIQPRLA